MALPGRLAGVCIFRMKKTPGNAQCDVNLRLNAYMPTCGVYTGTSFTTVHSTPNPFRERLAKRLAARGGKHRASRVDDGHLFRAEEEAVALAREACELRGKIGSPF